MLKAQHRLALSGTPIENHLGELWSLFEFLNPGMLGAASLFSLAGGSSRLDDETLSLLARGLRPFILRRTKDVVASELPARPALSIAMLYRQRHATTELRNHYRGRCSEGRARRPRTHHERSSGAAAAAHAASIAAHQQRIAVIRAPFRDAVPRLQELSRRTAGAGLPSVPSLLPCCSAKLDRHRCLQYLDGRTASRSRVARFSERRVSAFPGKPEGGRTRLNLTAPNMCSCTKSVGNHGCLGSASIARTRSANSAGLRLRFRTQLEVRCCSSSDKRRPRRAIVRAERVYSRISGASISSCCSSGFPTGRQHVLSAQVDVTPHAAHSFPMIPSRTVRELNPRRPRQTEVCRSNT